MKGFKTSLLKKHKTIALLAPSFIAEFDYPRIILQLKELGFDKVIELTFGAKMINRYYHEQLKDNKNLLISSVCPGIVEIIKKDIPQFEKNLINVDSPMIATAKICKKFFPKHKIAFISPCNFKKIEANSSKFIDYVLDYQELKQLFKQHDLEYIKISNSCLKKLDFDKFYNEYTRIYPLSGGLSKTAHLKQVLRKGEEKTIDGILEVRKFLKDYNPKTSKIRFLDVTFCKAGCIGGPFLSKNTSLESKHKRILAYLKKAEHKSIQKNKEGIIKKAKGINFNLYSTK